MEQTGEIGWLAGEIGGHNGWFPETYVEKIDDGEVHYIQSAPEATKLE